MRLVEQRGGIAIFRKQETRTTMSAIYCDAYRRAACGVLPEMRCEYLNLLLYHSSNAISTGGFLH